MHGINFMEISVTLNHKVLDLFISLIDQLRTDEHQNSNAMLSYSPNYFVYRDTNQIQTNNSKNFKLPHKSNLMHSPKIPASTKAGFNKFYKKYFG